MDQAHARALLAGARARLERLLAAESQEPDAADRSPDERLEVDPLAELTVEEAAAAEPGAMVGEANGSVGLASARHPYEVLEGADITPEE